MQYVLIGSGVAAVAAAEAIRQYDAYGEIIMLSMDPDGYYSRPGLAYYLTGELDEKHLFPFKKKDWKRLDVRTRRAAVQQILPDSHEVLLDNGARLRYDRLLVATGAQARVLNVPGSDLPGVFKLDDLQDARALVRQAGRLKTAVVTGGGITALELVEGLQARGTKVHYVLRDNRYWRRVLEPFESQIIETHLEEKGVVLHHGNEVVEILEKRGKVAGVRLADGKQIRANLVAYAIGIVPRSQLLRDAGARCDRGVLVDDHMQTNLPDVYAAGDVAQVYDPRFGRYVLESLWGPAREQGWVAGSNMAGADVTYQKKAAFNVTRLAGLTTTLIGAIGGGREEGETLNIVRGDSETWRELPDAIVAQSGFDINRIRLLVGKKSLVGAVVMGDQKLSYPIQRMVVEQVDISPIRDRLLARNARLSDELASFWQKVRPMLV